MKRLTLFFLSFFTMTFLSCNTSFEPTINDTLGDDVTPGIDNLNDTIINSTDNDSTAAGGSITDWETDEEEIIVKEVE